MVAVTIACEDRLSEAVIRKIWRESGIAHSISNVYSRCGYGYLKRGIAGFNEAARHGPWFVLTDLDRTMCAPQMLRQWLPKGRHENLIFRIAIREVEAWLMADRVGIARFLGVSVAIVPPDPEQLLDPKRDLIQLARRSKKRNVKDRIIPIGSAAQGPDYNSALCEFVDAQWNVQRAAGVARSLAGAMRALEVFSNA